MTQSPLSKFEYMVSYANLRRCWKQFSRGKKKKPDLIAFSKNLATHLTQLSNELQTGTYEHGPYTQFCVFEPKMRRISKASVRDRVVHHMLSEALNAIYEKKFIFHSYASRRGKGTHQGVIDLQKILYKATQNNTHACYFLKCDIKQFFDTASQDLLMKILQHHISSKPLLDLLAKVIYSYTTPRSALPRIGLPIGNLTSQVFSNIYMNELDQYVKHKLRVCYYLRYTDDFLLLSTDQDFLLQCQKNITIFLEDSLRLTLHPQKITLAPSLQGIDWLGYHLFFDHRLLRTKTKKRMFRRLHERLLAYDHQAVTLLSCRQTAASYLGMLSHATEYRLSAMISRLWGSKLPQLKRRKDLFFLKKFAASSAV